MACLIPKTGKSYDRFLSKLQQFSMNVIGPLMSLHGQLEREEVPPIGVIKSPINVSLSLLGNVGGIPMILLGARLLYFEFWKLFSLMLCWSM